MSSNDLKFSPSDHSEDTVNEALNKYEDNVKKLNNKALVSIG